MKRNTNPEDVLFTIAAVIGVGTIILFGIATIAKLIIHLIQ
jgi:hypothetical protein